MAGASPLGSGAPPVAVSGARALLPRHRHRALTLRLPPAMPVSHNMTASTLTMMHDMYNVDIVVETQTSYFGTCFAVYVFGA